MDECAHNQEPEGEREMVPAAAVSGAAPDANVPVFAAPAVADVLAALHAASRHGHAAPAGPDSEPTPVRAAAPFAMPPVADVLQALHAEYGAAPRLAASAVPLKERIPTIAPAVSTHARARASTPQGQAADGARRPEDAGGAAPDVRLRPNAVDMQARIIPFVPRTQPPAMPGPTSSAQVYPRPAVPFFTPPPEAVPRWSPPPAQAPPPDGFRGSAGLEDAMPTERGGGATARPRAAEIGEWLRGVPWRTVARRVAHGLVIALVAYVTLVLTLVVAYRWINPPMSSLMLTQRLTGTPVTQVWVPLERISPNLQHAVILSEDGQFCRHHGVDWGELKDAIEQSLEGTARGGSTITMQLVKNLFLWSSKSYVRKAIEIPLALLVERVWPKERVLEIYLNIAEWGPGIFGAEAASLHHFRKPAVNLTVREASLLAVSLPNPFDRQAGRPGAGTQRLADNLQSRMRRTAGVAACGRGPRGSKPGTSDRR